MNLSKLQLSAEESAMVCNSHWLLTKNIIMQKAYLLFGEAAVGLQSILAGDNCNEFYFPSPKIAKGENYRGLPYVMLDYPRHFGKEDVFAFRTMFWWGNFISFTWHIKGKFAFEYRQRIINAQHVLATAGFHLCISEDEWRHDFEETNYLPVGAISSVDLAGLLSNKPFIKLAVSIPLDRWNNAIDELITHYYLILEL